jgi:L-amino acid N-acyltransferase YncA
VEAPRSKPTIRAMVADDWPAVRTIYAEGIATGEATFETETPDWRSWDRGHSADLRFVALDGGAVAGWVAASPVSGRSCYAGVIEDSVYVDPARWGRGIGRQLLSRLVEEADRSGRWTIQAGVFPENRASIALHESCGFRIVGRRERLAQLGGVWRDVVLLERRRPQD